MTVNEMIEMNDTDFANLISDVRNAQSIRQQVAKTAFRVGNLVKWTSNRGNKCTGIVTKVMKKNIKVKQDRADETIGSPVMWSIAPSLLTAQ
jgi:hypothetical protein